MTTVGAVADRGAHARKTQNERGESDLDDIRACVQTLFGVSVEQFDASCTVVAVTCRIILASILLHHRKVDRAVVAEYIGLPEWQLEKIDVVFRGFYAIYSVPSNIGISALATKLREFFRGKEERIDLTTFRRAPSLVLVSKNDDDVPGSGARIQAMALAACDYLDVRLDAVLGAGRPREVVMARRVAMYCARLAGLSFPLIARQLGGRDHTAVLYTCRQMDLDLGGQKPDAGMGIADLLAWLTERLPELRAQRMAALSRREKQQKAFIREMAA